MKRIKRRDGYITLTAHMTSQRTQYAPHYPEARNPMEWHTQEELTQMETLIHVRDPMQTQGCGHRQRSGMQQVQITRIWCEPLDCSSVCLTTCKAVELQAVLYGTCRNPGTVHKFLPALVVWTVFCSCRPAMFHSNPLISLMELRNKTLTVHLPALPAWMRAGEHC